MAWTEITRPQYQREGRRYASDTTDQEWAAIEPHMPVPARTGRRRTHALREVVNAIFYIAQSGCQWRMLPKGFPPYPERVLAWEYPADHQARRVGSKGYIKWRDRDIYLTEALRGQTVALAPRDDGDWAVRFRQFTLAVLSDAANTIRPARLSRTAQADSRQPAAV
jgi:transposase